MASITKNPKEKDEDKGANNNSQKSNYEFSKLANEIKELKEHPFNLNKYKALRHIKHYIKDLPNVSGLVKRNNQDTIKLYGNLYDDLVGISEFKNRPEILSYDKSLANYDRKEEYNRGIEKLRDYNSHKALEDIRFYVSSRRGSLINRFKDLLEEGEYTEVIDKLHGFTDVSKVSGGEASAIHGFVAKYREAYEDSIPTHPHFPLVM